MESVTFKLSVSKERLLSGGLITSEKKILSGIPLCLAVHYVEKRVFFWCCLPGFYFSSVLYDGVFHSTLSYTDEERVAFEVSEERRCSTYPFVGRDSRLMEKLGERDLKISATVSVSRLSLVDLRVRQPETVQLELNDAKSIFVSKQQLSRFSPFFEALFSEPKDVYKLSDVDLFDFLFILNAIYGHHINYEEFKEHFLKSMLALAERFQIDLLFKEFEDFLLAVDTEKAKEWFEIADRHQMTRATKKILGTMTKAEIAESRAAMKGREYSAKTMSQLIERLMKL